MGGQYATRPKALVKFKLLEFSTNWEIQWSCNVNETLDPNKAPYDMILGRDLQEALGLIIDCKHH